MMQRTTTEIAAELAEFRAARGKLLRGELVQDVSRDGRRMKMANLSLADINEGIRELEREYAQAASIEDGNAAAPRRTAIGTGYY